MLWGYLQHTEERDCEVIWTWGQISPVPLASSVALAIVLFSTLEKSKDQNTTLIKVVLYVYKY